MWGCEDVGMYIYLRLSGRRFSLTVFKSSVKVICGAVEPLVCGDVEVHICLLWKHEDITRRLAS